MISARLISNNGSAVVLLILEPGNLSKLRAGEPIHKFLNEFVPGLPITIELLIAYSPDIEWLAARLKAPRVASGELFEMLKDSQSRPEVLRSGSALERMHRIETEKRR